MAENSALVPAAVGKFLRKRRKALKFTIDDVIEQTRKANSALTRQTLSRIERGEADLSLESAIALESVLGISTTLVAEVARTSITAEDLDAPGSSSAEFLTKAKEKIKQGKGIQAFQLMELAEDAARKRGQENDGQELLAEVLQLLAMWHARRRNSGLAKDLCQQARALPNAGLAAEIRGLIAEVKIGYCGNDYGYGWAWVKALEAKLPECPKELNYLATAVIASYFVSSKQWEDAEKWVLESLEIAKRDGSRVETLRTEVTLGKCRFWLGDQSDGMARIRKAIHVAKKEGFLGVMVNGLLCLGYLCLVSGELAQTEDHAKLARIAALGNKDEVDEFVSFFLLWRVAKARKDRRSEKRYSDVLLRLLPRVDQKMDEAREFLLEAGGPLWSEGKWKPRKGRSGDS